MPQPLFTVDITPDPAGGGVSIHHSTPNTPPQEPNSFLPFVLGRPDSNSFHSPRCKKGTKLNDYSDFIFFNKDLAAENLNRHEPIYDRYYRWRFASQKKPVRIPLQEKTYLTIGSADNGQIIQFRLSDKRLLEDFSAPNIAKFALIIFECTRPFKEVMITISDRVHKALPKLVTYLYAYRQMRATLTSNDESGQLHILGGSAPTDDPSPQAIEEALQEIRTAFSSEATASPTPNPF